MPDTSYLARVIYKELTSSEAADLSKVDFTGTYKLMVRAKTIPSPMSTPNTVESTTFEDDTQTYEMGIKTSDMKAITGNLEKSKFAELAAVEGKKLAIIHLYGTDGVGGTAKVAYVGTCAPTINDVGGVDEILEMTANVVQNTSSKVVTDSLTVVDNADGTFTVSKKS